MIMGGGRGDNRVLQAIRALAASFLNGLMFLVTSSMVISMGVVVRTIAFRPVAQSNIVDE